MSIDIEQAIASGDPRLMEEAFASMNQGLDQSEDGEQEQQRTPPAETALDDKQGSSPASVDAPKQEEEAAKPAGIAARDGSSVIPFAVLEGTRAQLKAEREARLELERKLHEAKGTALPDDIKLDELEELSPEVASAFRAMQARVQEAEKRAGNAMTQEQLQVEFAKQSNPDLIRWEHSDPERFGLAVEIDNALMNQPEYGQKTMAERFADVVRLVKQEFGDVPNQQEQAVSKSAQRAQQIVAEQQRNAATATPRTLTDVGARFSEAQRKQVDIWSEKSADEIAADMARMTPEQINQYLAGL